jgi:hypothetical protein
MQPNEAILKIEEEMSHTCGAMSKLIVSNVANKLGLKKTALSSREEYFKLIDGLVEPANKFLGKTKADESIQRWKKLV